MAGVVTLKAGRKALDPLNREVTVLRVEADLVTVRLAGPYGATVQYPRSVLRELEP